MPKDIDETLDITADIDEAREKVTYEEAYGTAVHSLELKLIDSAGFKVPLSITIRLKTGETATIGRENASGIYNYFNFPKEVNTVGKRHLLIDVRDNSIWITDLKSTNGTYLNGERLKPDIPVAVKSGDEIAFCTMHQIIYKVC